MSNGGAVYAAPGGARRLAARVRQRYPEVQSVLVLAPALVLLTLLYLLPLAQMLLRSILDPEFTLEHYQHFFTEAVYLRVLGVTFRMALAVTVLTLLLGFPVAYVLSTASPRWRNIMLLAVILPFWISILVRTYAWMVLLGRSGVVNETLLRLGLVTEPIKVINTQAGVLIGMTHILLPYMILPLYSVMRGIDPRLMQAASSLGAGTWSALRHVYLPLAMPGIVAGSILVFIISLGFYITPALLGGPRDQMVAMVIAGQVQTLLNWGFAAAISAVLLGTTLVLFAVCNRLVGLDQMFGGISR